MAITKMINRDNIGGNIYLGGFRGSSLANPPTLEPTKNQQSDFLHRTVRSFWLHQRTNKFTGAKTDRPLAKPVSRRFPSSRLSAGRFSVG